MKLNVLIASVYLFLFSCKTHEENKKYKIKESATENIKSLDAKFQGEFSSTVETEETTSGTASITYHFNIKNDIAVLTTKTYHEPIRCNGNYKAVENNGILELFYAGDEESCQSKKSKFKIKLENKKYYLQGLGGEATFNEWIELTRIKN
ncbi:hypothetical protein [Chryseobacterium indologenes]|uniref:hypothetical protein n=1 Tax=Chryseobacterium indologenes TaxID=253 RepID=UPI00102416E2|nr:hypothetical protein [Chryseobacterium indologenes]VFA43394.1 Uncharacterised protein [Chryseobacterium indologenes]